MPTSRSNPTHENPPAVNQLDVVEPHWKVFIALPFGAECLSLNAVEKAEYDRDPDTFAAKYLQGQSRADITRNLYRAWIHTYGTPLCGAKLANGERCNRACRPPAEHIDEFAAWHRIAACWEHAKPSKWPSKAVTIQSFSSSPSIDDEVPF